MKVISRSRVIAMVTSKVKVISRSRINEGHVKGKGHFKVKWFQGQRVTSDPWRSMVISWSKGHFGSMKVISSSMVISKVRSFQRSKGHGQGSFEGQMVTSDQRRSFEGQWSFQGQRVASDQWRSFQGQWSLQWSPQRSRVISRSKGHFRSAKVIWRSMVISRSKGQFRSMKVISRSTGQWRAFEDQGSFQGQRVTSDQ